MEPITLTAVEVKDGETKVVNLVPEEDPPGQELSVVIMGGAQRGFATDAESTYQPFVRVSAKFPLAKNPGAPRLHTIVDLGGAPGEAVGIEQIETWKTVEVSLGVSFYPFDLNVGLWGELGFSSHLPGDFEPRTSSPRWAHGGFIFDRFTRGSLKVGGGVDQRLDGNYQAALAMKGWVALYQAEEGSWKGAMISLVGDAVLGVNLFSVDGVQERGLHDVVRVGLCVGWNNKSEKK